MTTVPMHSVHRFVFLFVAWLAAFSGLAQSGPSAGDSLPTARRYPLKAFIVPSAMVAAGAGLLGEQTRAPFRSTTQVSYADDYLRLGPYGIRAALQLAGVKPAVSLGDEVAATVLANVFMVGFTEPLKRTVRSTRPDGSDRRSFPSGHTAVAFTGAELLHQAYRHRSPWISVAGYSLASATAVLRVANARHHWSDVVAGAGIGIASAKLSYLVYPYLKRKLTRSGARKP